MSFSLIILRDGGVSTFDISLGTLSTTGQIKVWTGTSFVGKPVKVWDGTNWTTKPLKRWDGLSWVITS